MQKMDNKGTKTTEEEYIELRSENARRFINEVPPALVRMGTVVITVIIVVLLLLAAFLVQYNGDALWMIIIDTDRL